MGFSSPSFLFVFLPLFLVSYAITPSRLKNGLIFIASLLFYSVDGGKLTAIICTSITINYFLGKKLSDYDGIRRKFFLFFGLLVNLLPLLYYRYGVFLSESTKDLFYILGHPLQFEKLRILLPAGISFFTFHAISYLVDIYFKKINPCNSFVDFGMYMSNFPQLIAGPIVRYSEVQAVIKVRPFTALNFYIGITQFVIGLSKKVIIADNAGVIADQAFDISNPGISFGFAWIGIVSYAIQIYFDFSGYTDMAIGLGKVMGFNFPQNFNQPYRSKNITEFWRRWHMSLSRWFLDYVYIPLGGNRLGDLRTFLNLFVVFFLCGFWHGASYIFIIWGIYHGFILVVERILTSKFGFKTSGFSGQIFTFILVLVGWVFFRSSNINQALNYLHTMFLGPVSKEYLSAINLSNDKLFFLILGFIIATFPNINLQFSSKALYFFGYIKPFLILLIFIISLSFVSANTFNPFIYFRF